ncbi:LysE family translocator [Paraburkholderia sp.]|uniref:LysE family translocator n=1 Tax=Paraburkholderia sp. TaxID=1926495 RepID=UPI00238AAEEF|nr:LysE family translocator [Paraburkholderia sp.]MDE1181459.1 LysE family translocator [Paraburkholderia sp.]
MHYLPALLQIAAVYFIAVATPGPNFFMVTQLSLAGRRGLGASSALGVGTGSTIWAALAMLGLAAVLQKIDWLYNGVRIFGAIYLVYFGIKLVIASRKRDTSAAAPITPPPANDAAAHFRAYRSGLLTCLTNPKSCVFWTSVFAAMFPAHPPLWFYGVVLTMIGCMSAGWYGSVALMFATERTQRSYRRLRRPIDGLCGALLVGLGAKLAADR